MSAVDLGGARCLVTGGAGTIGSHIVDELVAEGAAEVVVLDNFVRGRRANLDQALASGRVAIVDGDIRDRELVVSSMQGIDVCFHQAAIRITQCAEEPRLAMEVLADGTFNVIEAAADAGVRKIVAASSASVYGLAETFPTPESQHPYDNDTFYGAAKTFNEGMLRSFRAMRGLELRGPALLQRVRTADGRARLLHRGARPVDGADRRRQAPADLRRRHPDDGLRVQPEIARANVLAATSTVGEGVYNIASGTETSLLELARMLLKVMDSDLGRRVRPGQRRQRRDPSARRHQCRRTRLGLPGVGRARGGPAPVGGVVAAAARGDRRGPDQCDRSEPMSRINVMQPWMGEAEIAAVSEVIASGWVAQGPRVAAFEGAFATRMRADHAVATSSCTTALHLALVVAGIGPGDEVVVPSFSFIATTNAVVYVGATPVFADVDAQTGNLTAATVEPVLTARTRAVIVVDQGGVPVDLTGIRALCDPRSVTVVEDAACGAGSTHRGRPVGAGAEVTAWSFHPRKIVTTGEGGMLTTSNSEWAARARRLREHAMSVSAADRHRSAVPVAEQYLEVGFNFRMTDLQAALGLVQLGRLDEVVERRRQIAEGYRKALADVPGLRCVGDPEHGTTNYQSFWVEVAAAYPLNRDELLAHLGEQDISARGGIMAAHRQPAYAGHPHAPLPVTERLTDTTLILPVFHQMDGDQQQRVIDAVREPARISLGSG